MKGPSQRPQLKLWLTGMPFDALRAPGRIMRNLLMQALFMLWVPYAAVAQTDTAKVVPDGTEGEVLVTADSLIKAKEKKPTLRLCPKAPYALQKASR